MESRDADTSPPKKSSNPPPIGSRQAKPRKSPNPPPTPQLQNPPSIGPPSKPRQSKPPRSKPPQTQNRPSIGPPQTRSRSRSQIRPVGTQPTTQQVSSRRRYSSLIQTGYFLLKNWLIFIIRILSFCFKIKTRRIDKPTDERTRANRIFNKYYPDMINYLFKMSDTWNVGTALENMNRSHLKTMAKELKIKMQKYHQVRKL